MISLSLRFAPSDLIAQALREERQLEMRRRIHPKSKEDFAILFNELDAWRRGEITKIKVRTCSKLFHPSYGYYR